MAGRLSTRNSKISASLQFRAGPLPSPTQNLNTSLWDDSTKLTQILSKQIVFAHQAHICFSPTLGAQRINTNPGLPARRQVAGWQDSL